MFMGLNLNLSFYLHLDGEKYLIIGWINMFRVKDPKMVGQLISVHLMVDPMLSHRDVSGDVGTKHNITHHNLKLKKY